MSPYQALHSPILLTYIVLVAGVLALAGLIIAFFQRVMHKPMKSVWLTYKGWLIMIPLVGGDRVPGPLGSDRRRHPVIHFRV